MVGLQDNPSMQESLRTQTKNKLIAGKREYSFVIKLNLTNKKSPVIIMNSRYAQMPVQKMSCQDINSQKGQTKGQVSERRLLLKNFRTRHIRWHLSFAMYFLRFLVGGLLVFIAVLSVAHDSTLFFENTTTSIIAGLLGAYVFAFALRGFFKLGSHPDQYYWLNQMHEYPELILLEWQDDGKRMVIAKTGLLRGDSFTPFRSSLVLYARLIDVKVDDSEPNKMTFTWLFGHFGMVKTRENITVQLSNFDTDTIQTVLETLQMLYKLSSPHVQKLRERYQTG